MKRILLLFYMSLFTFGNISAQQGPGIKAVKPDMTDVIRTLEVAGYQLYSFDLSSLKGKTYEIEVFLEETDSTGTKQILRVNFGAIDVTPSDKKNGQHREVGKVSVAVVPTNVDSIQRVSVSLGKKGGITPKVNLRPLERDAKNYHYQSRPFRLTEFQPEVDIPLLLYGSAWYDEKSQVHRFCGESEIDPDMSTEILKYIPHYYIIGIRLTETN